METLVKPKSGTRRKVHPDLTPKEVKPGSNEADAETMLVFLGQIERHEAKVAAEKKLLNRVWKLAINAGIVRKDLELVRRFADQDADTVLQTMARIKKYAQALDVPIGSQFNLFEIPNSSILSSDELSERAHRAGYVAGLTGKNPDDQAYPAGHEHHARHMEGWHAGQKILLERIMPITIALESEGKAEEPAPASTAEPELENAEAA